MNKVSGEKLIFDCVRHASLGVCIFAAFLLMACSIPNLEPPECTAARGSVRELFSYHFGNDMHFSQENLAARERFLAPDFVSVLKSSPPGLDPFTLTGDDDPPKAFRVGTCSAAGNKANLQVLLFWKTDARSEQRELNVEAVKKDDKWLVNGISNR